MPDPLLRIAVFLLALLLGLPLWQSSVWALLPAAVFALAVLVAAPATALLMLLVLGVSYMLAVPQGSPVLLIYIAGLHALFLAMALLSRLPRGSRIPLAALKTMAVRNLPLQAASQALAAVALLVGNAGTSLLVVGAGSVALCVLSVWMARRFGRG